MLEPRGSAGRGQSHKGILQYLQLPYGSNCTAQGRISHNNLFVGFGYRVKAKGTRPYIYLLP